MFIENEFARPLFDFDKGGPAKAFQCLLCKEKPKITRTERGMRMHLKSVHEWEEQPYLYSMESQTDSQKEKSRKRQADQDSLRKSLRKVTEKIHNNQKLLETNEGELLKLTREEK